MMYYCFRSLRGDFSQADPEYVTNAFGSMLADYPTMIFWTVLICVIGFIVCKFGLQSGIEKVTKVMMIALLAIMVVLAIHSVLREQWRAFVSIWFRISRRWRRPVLEMWYSEL